MSEELRKGSKLLASLALFGIMHKNKKSTYEIIEEFLVEIIKTEKLYSFSTSDINSLLYETYEFDIVEAVIKTILKKAKYLEYNNHSHNFTVVDDTLLETFQLNEESNKNALVNNKFMYDLNKYISDKTGEKLTEEVKKEIFKAFTDFMLDQNIENKYSIYVKSYILDHEDDKDFVENLQTIKEGVLLYEGLKFDSSEQGIPHRFKLDIYLNIEILFHLVNFDGKVQKLLVEDFISLVKDINRKDKCITLRCLHKTKEEIEYFFNTAERIVNGEEKLNSINNAMPHIVKGCKNTIEVIAKKTEFYKELKKFNILIDEEDDELYTEDNHEFSISSNELIEKYTKDETTDDSPSNEVGRMVELLNIINIKRKGKSNRVLEKSKVILLSDNYKIRKIGADELVLDENTTPLSVSLQYLTTRFWFKLNKGFGNTDAYPSSFKVITKAQILLGNEVKNKINEQYHEFKNKPGYSEEDSMAILTNLKERLQASNDITANNVDLIIDTLEEDNIDSYAKEHSRIRKQAKEQEKQNKYLYDELTEQNNENSNLKDKIAHLETVKNEQEKEEFERLDRKSKKIKKKVEKQISIYKAIISIAALLPGIISSFLIYNIGWSTLEPIAWVGISMIGPVACWIYLSVYEKDWNIKTVINNKKEKITELLEDEYEFDEKRYEELKKAS